MLKCGALVKKNCRFFLKTKNMKKKRCIAIIPARGGSKRIKKKNIKLFFGRPMISYAIKNAIKSKLFDEVIVSTDDLEIKKKQFGLVCFISYYNIWYWFLRPR